jgi:hypothetical protein
MALSNLMDEVRRSEWWFKVALMAVNTQREDDVLDSFDGD